MDYKEIADQIDTFFDGIKNTAGRAPIYDMQVRELASVTLSLCLPSLRGPTDPTLTLVEVFFGILDACVESELGSVEPKRDLTAILPALIRDAHLDCEALMSSDPSVNSLASVSLSFPGVKALVLYRLAHELWNLGAKILARALTEFAHEFTGIDIHPGATLGKRIAIDHGTGIVIGETAVVGSNVRMYQGVTLGNLHVVKSQAGTKRHPTVEDDCILYAYATILGGRTVIGKGSFIGGGVLITKSVPPDSKITVEQPKQAN